MAATPEGKVKAKISSYLKSQKDIFYTMPVPSGLGESTLDYLGAISFGEFAFFFAIEAKKPGGKPTERQVIMMDRMGAVGIKTFVIDGELGELQEWITKVRNLTDVSNRTGLRPPD